MITYFYGDPENQILFLGATPLSLFRELHLHPAACRHLECQLGFRFLAFSPFSEPPVLGEGEGAVRFSPCCSPFGAGLGGPLPLVGGLRTFVLHQGYPYQGISPG